MRILFGFILILTTFPSFAQEFLIRGKVVDNSNKEPLVGAKIVVNETIKVLSDYDGNYTIKVDKAGEYKMEVTMLLFSNESYTITVVKPVTNFDIFLGNSQELEEVKVIGNLVTGRKTPVAVTKISQKQITEELGSRDLPMLLNATPGVYATQSGGGDGDSRINVRGFDQRNIGVLIDGVPVNDMESGAVYWSNWFGLDAITSTVQVQRGLGATKLALPSIGGSINIITQGVGNKKVGMLKQEYGSGNFLRTSLSYNSGLNANGWGMTLAASYKKADGWVDGTPSKGAFLYTKIQKRWGKHLTSFSGFMAPQEHGQRSYKNPIAYWDSETARKLGINIPDSAQIPTKYDNGIRHNSQWGYYTDKNGKQQVKNAALNFYNKPQITLKDFWIVNEKLSISNLAYMSIGRGGGTRIRNSSGILSDTTDGTIDWDAMIKSNQQYEFFGTTYPNVDPTYSPLLYKSNNYILASINNHFWVGYLPQFTYNQSKNLSISGGLDFRYYKGTHYQEITDLLGGEYALSGTNKNSRTEMKFVGDKVALQPYNNHRDGLVTWSGVFGQAEYTKGRWTTFINISGIVNGYKAIDYFVRRELTVGDTVLKIGYNDTVQYQGNTYTRQSEGLKYSQTDWKYLPGGTIKLGAHYELTEFSGVFLNLGYLSRTPQFSNVIDNNTNTFFAEILNEKVQAIEGGYNYSNNKFGINVNGYFTNWKNKPFPFGVAVPDPNDPTEMIRVNINGMDAIHYGGEVDLAYSINKKHSFEAMFSMGNWTWNSTEVVTVPQYNVTFTFDAKGVHVGDAAQTVLSLAYRWEPIKGMYIKPQFQFFDRYYADFSPFALQGENAGRESWVMPSYSLVNLYAGYRVKLKNNALLINGSVINVLGSKYISDASPLQGNSTAFEAVGTQVFFGGGLRFNVALGLQF